MFESRRVSATCDSGTGAGVRVRTLASDTALIQPGQPVALLNVWATWCGPCEKEFPEIEALQREFGRADFASSRWASTKAAMRTFGSSSPRRAHRSRSGEIPKEPYQGIGVPESYLIASDGTFLLRQFGAIPDGGAAIRAAIQKAL